MVVLPFELEEYSSEDEDVLCWLEDGDADDDVSDEALSLQTNSEKI